MKRSMLAVSILLCVGACGGQDAPTETKESPTATASASASAEPDVASGPGTYYTETGNTYLTIDLTGSQYSGDGLLDRTREIAESTGNDFPSVVRVDVDNSSGDSEWSPGELRIVTSDGQTLSGRSARDVAGIPIDEGNTDDIEAYNRSVNASNEWSDRDAVLPGAKSSTYFFFDEKVDDVSRVFLDDAEAFKRE